MAIAAPSYDRAAVLELLRSTSVSQLRRELAELPLDEEHRAALDALLAAWEWRAFGPLPLRDALVADPARGLAFYQTLSAALLGEIPAELPSELPDLLPAPPAPLADPAFEPPSGRRRAVATALVTLGLVWLLVQLLVRESVAVRPAGVPLALFTLALLVGVRAHWQGFLGSACIWLVANLPGFHHRTVLSWPTLPLLAVGVLLLALDGRIRAMWAWASSSLRGR
jgi:hypothetical protein